MEDRVQLKREESVGNELVLSDINPKSNTKSIDDPSTGASLDKTIERMWNAINNKLSRVVNSVNGRTGVVVLSAEDVGLGNVDNVSYADIKQWVISRTAQEFGFKRIELFDTLLDLDNQILEWGNDEVYANKPFYARRGYNNDMRGYIGYIYFDNGQLKHTQKVIDSIGFADNSIVYSENLPDGLQYADTGGIGVNIWKYEDALELYNDVSGSKAESGLRIDKTKIASKMYYFNGVYGDGNPEDSSALLYYEPSSYPADTSKMKRIIFYLNGAPMLPDTALYYTKQEFKINDIIVTNFSDEGYRDGIMYKENMKSAFMLRQTAIGQVVDGPTIENPKANYVVNFYSLKPFLGRGLKYEKSHQGSTSSTLDNSISLDLLHGNVTANNAEDNVSGLNAFNRTSIYETGQLMDKSHHTVTPLGDTIDTFNGNVNAARESSGVFITPDFSLCVIPKNTFSPTNPNNPIPNWPMKAPADNEGMIQTKQSLLGINLIKIPNNKIDEDGSTGAINISGLRVVSDTEDVVSPGWFGKGSGDEDVVLGSVKTTGGLAVNVGKFLEIGGMEYYEGYKIIGKDPSKYYNSGKVNVRINEAKGIINDGENRISVRLSKVTNSSTEVFDNSINAGGLTFVEGVENSSTPGIAIDRGLGLKMSCYRSNGSKQSQPNSLAVSIADTMYDADLTGLEDTNKKDLYGGLRYLCGNEEHKHISTIGVRVNDSEDLSKAHVGTEGLKITDDNVLGIQLLPKLRSNSNVSYLVATGDNPLTITKAGDATEDDPSGLVLNFHKDKGLVCSSYTTGNELGPALAVKIYDRTFYHDYAYDGSKGKIYTGALRFSVDGHLAIRVNNNGIDYENRTGSINNLDDGDYGLRIWPGNVLGIKYDYTRNDIALDDDGNLIISPLYRPHMESLKIGEHEYNGSKKLEITLGPGLVLEPDPETDDAGE